MLRPVSRLQGMRLAARDGDVGKVKDLYFDDRSWTVRYLVVDTGSWLSRRHGLVSPFAVTTIDDGEPAVHTGLSRSQVEQSPDIDTDKPVSRQAESALLDFYGYPYYWMGPLSWGPVAAPSDFAAMARLPPPQPAQREAEERDADPHLRSASEVRGYNVIATDGGIGHIEDFLYDDRDWAIRYAVIDTRNWLPGRHVLIEPAWIDRVWLGGEALVKVSRNAIESSPDYDLSQQISAEDEARLRRHYLRFQQTFHDG